MLGARGDRVHALTVTSAQLLQTTHAHQRHDRSESCGSKIVRPPPAPTQRNTSGRHKVGGHRDTVRARPPPPSASIIAIVITASRNARDLL